MISSESVGDKQGLQTNGRSQVTTEKLRQLQRIEYHYRDYKVNRGKSKHSCTIQEIAKHTIAHYGKCEKSEMIVAIKCETLSGYMSVILKVN